MVLAKLDTYFNPKINITFERYVFKKASQEEAESASNYVTRLRRLGETCEYGTKIRWGYQRSIYIYML